jgi:hypothetical protein
MPPHASGAFSIFLEVSTMTGPDPRGIYFDSAHLGEPSLEYVCWLDIMGTTNQMLRSLPIAANFIFKLHCAALEACDDLESTAGVRLYPVMDGIYVTSDRRTPLTTILNRTLLRLVNTFLYEEKCFHQFLVRGAIAFGPIYHGANLDARTAHVLESHAGHRDAILMGLPMAQAYGAEADAPPFGIAVHSSARAFAPAGDRPFRFIWLNWFRSAESPIQVNELLEKLGTYFDWQRDHCNMTGYDPSRIQHHRDLSREFFTSGD